MSWTRADVDLGQVYRRGEEFFKVVAICDLPTVILEPIGSGAKESHAIGSRHFDEFVRLFRAYSDGSYEVHPKEGKHGSNEGG